MLEKKIRRYKLMDVHRELVYVIRLILSVIIHCIIKILMEI